jgi:hypothetical protein
VTTETNPVVLVLARIAAAVDARERAAAERRRTIRLVEQRKPGGKVA